MPKKTIRHGDGSIEIPNSVDKPRDPAMRPTPGADRSGVGTMTDPGPRLKPSDRDRRLPY